MKREKLRILFVCVHNSARSQMAEAYLNKFGMNAFYTESAGLEPGKLNPLIVEVMKEESIDISNNKTNSVFDFYNEGRKYDFVITVCDEANGEKCPLFLGGSNKPIHLHWSFSDPSSFTGTKKNKLEKIRKVRTEIKKKILEFINIENK